MNVTVEMLVGVVALLTLTLTFGRFLYTMKSDIMDKMVLISEQNAAFRLESANNLHAIERQLDDKLTTSRTDITKLSGRVDSLEAKVDEIMS